MKFVFKLCIFLSLGRGFILINNNRRVAYGTLPPYFSYPYTSQVWLNLTEELSSTYCTGTIITDLMILTAAHCLDNKIKVDIYYGSFQRSTSKRLSGKRWWQHPKWLKDRLDIGLIVAEESLSLTLHIRIAEPGSWITERIFDNESRPSLLCGWGLQENNHLNGLKCMMFAGADQKCLYNADYLEYEWFGNKYQLL